MTAAPYASPTPLGHIDDPEPPGLFGIVPSKRASCERCLNPRMEGARFCAKCAHSLKWEMSRAGYLEPKPPQTGPWEFLRCLPLDHGRMKDGHHAAHPELRYDERHYQ